jgi:hypothetical protein
MKKTNHIIAVCVVAEVGLAELIFTRSSCSFERLFSLI